MALSQLPIPPEFVLKSFDARPPGTGFMIRRAADGTLGGFYIEEGTPIELALAAGQELGMEPELLDALAPEHLRG